MSNSLWPHGKQHTRLPSLSPGVCSNSWSMSQWWHPTISSSVAPSFPPRRVFANELAFHSKWPKYWNFSSPSNEYSGLISFRIDCGHCWVFQISWHIECCTFLPRSKLLLISRLQAPFAVIWEKFQMDKIYSNFGFTSIYLFGVCPFDTMCQHFYFTDLNPWSLDFWY